MDKNKDAELKKLELEEQRLVNETRLKELELELKRKELEAKLEELKPARIFRLSSFSPTTIAAILGLMATGIGYIIQSNLNRELEREKFQGQLILKAIETGDQKKALTNLKFFVDTGLLTDPTGKIAVALGKGEQKPEHIPVLPVDAGPEGALDYYKYVLVNDPSNPSAHINIGKIYLRAGQYEEALHNFFAAIHIDPKLAEAYYLIATTYNKTGDPEEAKRYCEKAKQLDPNLPGC